MTELFDRTATLQVNNLILNNLHFSFKVDRSLRPVAGKCEIKAWNLSSTTRGQLDSQSSVSVALKAGYQGNNTSIFSGTLRHVSHAYDGKDWITTISSEDGGKQMRNAKTSRSFRPGTTIGTVLNAIAQDAGVGPGNLNQAVAAATLNGYGNSFPTGTALRGFAMNQLDELCRAIGFEWSIQNGALQFLPIGASIPGQPVVLSASSGLVGSPTKEQRGIIKFKTLMIPGLEPGRTVAMQSQVITGTYKINACTYTGDTHGAAWNIDCEAKPVGSS